MLRPVRLFRTLKHFLSSTQAVLLTSMLLFGFSAAWSQQKADALKQGFENPPASARPRVWWHWMNGNITQEGIKLDLEWMQRAHIAGFQQFDAALFTPQLVEKRLAYMTPEWKDAFKYAVTLGQGMGMEEAIAGSPGWSETGGPWVPASQAMKKYVWSETLVEGGKPFTGKLAQPPGNTGALQDLPVDDPMGGSDTHQQFYADSAVVAYKLTANEAIGVDLRPEVTSSGGSIDATLLHDGDLVRGVEIPKAPRVGEKAWILFKYPQPVTIQSLTARIVSEHNLVTDFMGISLNGARTLEASDDGQTFREVVTVPADGAPEHTLEFAPTTARYFRLALATPPPGPDIPKEMYEGFGIQPQKPSPSYSVTEFVLHVGARVNRFEEKAAFIPQPDLYKFATPAVAPQDAIQKNDVVDLTSRMKPDGSLDWTPPPGRWRVVRIGYSLLGITNHPATKESTGLEVDKLNRGFVKDYMDNYLDSYKQTVGPEMMGKQGIRYVITDSWEAGAQNWTDNMLAEFTQRRGYDPRPWLPVLAGHVVESAEASDQFLWDLRKTIADLTADEHYGQVEASLKERGMGHYGESHESGRAFIADGMEVKKLDDIPMSAMWTQSPGVNAVQYGYNADDRESASVAHIYRQNIAAAESMTAVQAPWGWSPETLKPTADQEFLNGINRIVIHESTHQPFVDRKPGLTLGPFGQWFNRNETWAEQAALWIDYLARTSFLLQQGQFAADIVYFYGEDSNLTSLFANKAPDLPAGYGFDYINADGLIHELSVSHGRLVTKSGMQYKLLALDPNSVRMSLPVLRSIYKLVQQGAVVVGPRPTSDPSLADDPAEFARLTSQLFGDGSGVHAVGQGQVHAGQSAAEVLGKLQETADFSYTKPKPDTRLEFVHRHLPDCEIYFVDNRSASAQTVDATFRVHGKAPELWRAETGTVASASYKIDGGRTTVPLQLEPWGTVFVVFRKNSKEAFRTVPHIAETKLADVAGPWTVAFQPGGGAPKSTTLDKLVSWSESSDAGIKYFSGIGTYTQSIQAPTSWFAKGAHVWIDLGEVKNLAVVTVNGKNLGTVWHAPFRIDATSALKPGINEVKVEVINAWVNRLIGDQQPGATKYTFADVQPYNSTSPLLPSGLLGPVTVLQTKPEN